MNASASRTDVVTVCADVAGAAGLGFGAAGHAARAAAQGSCLGANTAGTAGLAKSAAGRASTGSGTGAGFGTGSGAGSGFGTGSGFGSGTGARRCLGPATPAGALGCVRRRSVGARRNLGRGPALAVGMAVVSVGTALGWGSGAELVPVLWMGIVLARQHSHQAERQQETRASLCDCHQNTPMAETPAVPGPKTGLRLRLDGVVRADRTPK